MVTVSRTTRSRSRPRPPDIGELDVDHECDSWTPQRWSTWIRRRARDSNPRGACTPSGFQERTTHRSDLLRYGTGSTVHHQLTTKALQRGNSDHFRCARYT